MPEPIILERLEMIVGQKLFDLEIYFPTIMN